MLKFVTVTKRQSLGLPDPSNAFTPKKADRIEAVNKTVIESFYVMHAYALYTLSKKNASGNLNFYPSMYWHREHISFIYDSESHDVSD